MAINGTSPKKRKVVDIPSTPTIGTATADIESASVVFTAATVGGPATTFTALSNPGSITGSGSSSPVTVSGLTAGTAYTFTVRGINATGNSEYSSASNSVTPLFGTSFESIATLSGTGSSGTISFTSIPSTYKHLQIRAIARENSGGGSNDTFLGLSFNGSSGNNYATHYLNGDGASTSASGSGSYPRIFPGIAAQNSAPSNVMGVFVLDLLDYASTNKYKTTRSLMGFDKNGSGSITITSGLWLSTSAINQIDIYSKDGQSFTTSTTIALYGIKG
jgi:hypothetical protein